MKAIVEQDHALTQFLREHHGSLFRTALLLTGDAVDAEELLQDTLVRLFPRWHWVEEADRPVAYVRRSLTNLFISDRRRGHHRDLPLTHVSESTDRRQPLEAVHDRSVLWPALLALPSRQRAAIVLRYYDDLPDAEIADALGCRPVSVRSLVSRGMSALRSALDPTRPEVS
ncbi:SigE family RNA polymerase sigma factor [Dermatophilaceae bacterium Soc4.6]